MCHDPASRPPPPPISNEAAASGLLTLTSADGTRFSAAYATPVGQARAAIVVLPDVRGLHGYYIELVKSLAVAGYASIALDYFGRTAGLAGEYGREADFDFAPEIERTTPDTVDADTAAAIAEIRSRATSTTVIFTIGFCFGGSNAWRQSAGTLDLAGCVGFYGRPERVGDAADQATKPVLMLLAGDDFATPLADQLALAQRMRDAGADVVDVVFPGAPHSFFDRNQAAWAAECDEAWRQIIAFTERVTAEASVP